VKSRTDPRGPPAVRTYRITLRGVQDTKREAQNDSARQKSPSNRGRPGEAESRQLEGTKGQAGRGRKIPDQRFGVFGAGKKGQRKPRPQGREKRRLTGIVLRAPGRISGSASRREPGTQSLPGPKARSIAGRPQGQCREPFLPYRESAGRGRRRGRGVRPACRAPDSSRRYPFTAAAAFPGGNRNGARPNRRPVFAKAWNHDTIESSTR
jgi:hypothetical protein